MKTEELLLDFLKFHYKENPFIKESTNKKYVAEYLASKKPDKRPRCTCGALLDAKGECSAIY